MKHSLCILTLQENLFKQAEIMTKGFKSLQYHVEPYFVVLTAYG